MLNTNIALVYRANAKLNGGRCFFVLHGNTVSIRNLGIILFLKLSLMHALKAEIRFNLWDRVWVLSPGAIRSDIKSSWQIIVI